MKVMRTTNPRWSLPFAISLLLIYALIVYIFTVTINCSSHDDTKNSVLACVISNIVTSFHQCWCTRIKTANLISPNGRFRSLDTTSCMDNFDQIQHEGHRITHEYSWVKNLQNYFTVGKRMTEIAILRYRQLSHDLRNHLNRLNGLQHFQSSKQKERQAHNDHGYNSKPTIISASKLLEHIQMYEKRIGRACDPTIDSYHKYETSTGEQMGTLRSKVEGDMNSEDFSKINVPYPGMLLQIFPQQSDLVSQSLTLNAVVEENELDDDTTGFELRSSSHTSVNRRVTNAAYHNFFLPCKEISMLSANGLHMEKIIINIKEYQLIEILNRSLGQVDRHNQDYAYRPVMKLLGSSSTIKNTWFVRDGGSEFDYARMGHRAFAGGSHGEVWKAKKRCNQVDYYGKTSSNHFYQHNPRQETCDDTKNLILKRMKVGKDSSLMEAGLREIYFGDILSRSEESSSLFTVYVDHFFLQQSYSRTSSELWIVFEDAGPSLRSYIYTPVASGDFVVYQHSPLWRQLRMNIASTATKSSSSSVEVITEYKTCPSITAFESEKVQTQHNLKKSSYLNSNDMIKPKVRAKKLLKDILHQILKSAAKLHERGIVHRYEIRGFYFSFYTNTFVSLLTNYA